MAAAPLMVGDMPARPAQNVIEPGAVWPDNRGRHVQAHGGGMTKLGDTWYWFAEDRSQGNDPARRYVGCYSSRDLVRWTFRNAVGRAAGIRSGLAPRTLLVHGPSCGRVSICPGEFRMAGNGAHLLLVGPLLAALARRSGCCNLRIGSVPI